MRHPLFLQLIFNKNQSQSKKKWISYCDPTIRKKPIWKISRKKNPCRSACSCKLQMNLISLQHHLITCIININFHFQILCIKFKLNQEEVQERWNFYAVVCRDCSQVSDVTTLIRVNDCENKYPLLLLVVSSTNLLP